MTLEAWIAMGSLIVAILVAIFAILAITPKELLGRIVKLEIGHATTQRDHAHLVKTVDNLANTVGDLTHTINDFIAYGISAGKNHNGRSGH